MIRGCKRQQVVRESTPRSSIQAKAGKTRSSPCGSLRSGHQAERTASAKPGGSMWEEQQGLTRVAGMRVPGPDSVWP